MPLLLTGRGFRQELERAGALALYAPLEGGAETRLLRRLRAAGYRAPIVLLTAHPEGGDTERAMRAGCSAYVGKPVDPAVLEQTLIRVLEKQ